MGDIVVDVQIRFRNEVFIKALADTGFYGDVITKPEVARKAGVELKHRRLRTLPDGRRVEVAYGGAEVILKDEVTWGDIETWDELKLPQGIDALIGVTALEKLGFKANPKPGNSRK